MARGILGSGSSWKRHIAQLDRVARAYERELAKKHKKKKQKNRSPAARGNVGLPFGKWLKGPFRLRKNSRGVLIDLKR